MKTSIPLLQKQIEQVLFGNKVTLEVLDRYGLLNADEIVSCGIESLMERVNRQKARENFAAASKLAGEQPVQVARDVAVRKHISQFVEQTWNDLEIFVYSNYPHLQSRLSLENMGRDRFNIVNNNRYYYADLYVRQFGDYGVTAQGEIVEYD